MRVLRVFVLGLMVLALPLQGFAAASLALCHTGDARSARLMDTQAHPDTHAAEHAHHHLHGHMSADTDAAKAPSQDAASTDHACSQCANCCSVVALALGVSASPALESWPAVQVAATRLLHSDVTLHSIERPPPATDN